MKIDIAVETKLSDSSRIQQLSAMFDVPPAKKSRIEWRGDLPIEAEPWNVGLIVGTSGSGKSTIARNLFGDHYDMPLEWGAGSVIDDFPKSISISDISDVCQAVGFNTIPAWMRPYGVLSNGEKFRVELARRLVESGDPIVVDEFTSVVDRQVAQIGSHAVQKFVRKNNRQFVAVSCHRDIIDWLQPDWIFEPATMQFSRRLLRRRPPLEITIGRLPYAAWKMFAPFHYMSATLHPAARCFGLWVSDRLAAFAAILHRPAGRYDGKTRPIKAVSRVVTLPDWQGLGLAFVLIDKLGAAYRAVGCRLRNYPAHPAFVRAHRRSNAWATIKESGNFSTKVKVGSASWGGRPCGIFEYIGDAISRNQAETLIATG